MEGWEFPVLQGIWQGFLWFLRVLPFIVAAAVVIAIWRQYLKTRNIKVAKHLLEIKSTNIIDINRVISELNDFSSMSKKLGHHDETIDTLIQKLRQLRDNPFPTGEKDEITKIDTKGKIFCPKCGKETPTTISICIYCGAKLPKEYLEPQEKPVKSFRLFR